MKSLEDKNKLEILKQKSFDVLQKIYKSLYISDPKEKHLLEVYTKRNNNLSLKGKIDLSSYF